jgi:hypothetical protein
VDSFGDGEAAGLDSAHPRGFNFHSPRHTHSAISRIPCRRSVRWLTATILHPPSIDAAPGGDGTRYRGPSPLVRYKTGVPVSTSVRSGGAS